MTDPNSATYDPQQIAHLKTFLDRARTAYDQGNLLAARNAVAQYYQAQMPGGTLGVNRGYAGLAYGVATGTGVPGRTAMGVLNDIGGKAVTPETKTNLMMDLANADLDTIRQNGGGWPVMKQIENYHAPAYKKNGFPAEAWGGAALAHDSKRWDADTLTPPEVGDGSHGTAYQSLTPGQVVRNAGSVLENGAGQTGSLLAHTFHPYDALPSGSDLSAAGNEVGAMVKAGAAGIGNTLNSGWSAVKDGFDGLTGTPAPPAPPPPDGSSSAAPAVPGATTSLATPDSGLPGPDGTTQTAAGQDQTAASPYDSAALTDQDEAELTPDFASWNALMNGTEPDLMSA